MSVANAPKAPPQRLRASYFWNCWDQTIACRSAWVSDLCQSKSAHTQNGDTYCFSSSNVRNNFAKSKYVTQDAGSCALHIWVCGYASSVHVKYVLAIDKKYWRIHVERGIISSKIVLWKLIIWAAVDAQANQFRYRWTAVNTHHHHRRRRRRHSTHMWKFKRIRLIIPFWLGCIVLARIEFAGKRPQFLSWRRVTGTVRSHDHDPFKM